MVTLYCGCIYSGEKGAYTKVCCTHSKSYRYYEPHGHYISITAERCSSMLKERFVQGQLITVEY